MLRLATLVVLIALAAGFSHAAYSQQSAGVQRIGFLGPLRPASPPPAPPPPLEVFRAALAELGLFEGRNIIIETRWPDGNQLERLPESAAALVSLKPEVIVAVGATAARAAIAATTDIPIVFVGVVDPVATRLTTNLERPGGNVTGFTSFDPQQARRQLEILKAAIPGLTRIALLSDAGAASDLGETNEDAARTLGLQVQVIKVARTANPDFAGALKAAKSAGAGAVVVLSTPVTTPHRKLIVDLAATLQLPTLSPRDHEDASPVICYGTSFSELTKRAAAYVEKILKGAKPGDLAVETVRQPELIINLRTARAIGFALPPVILGKATRIIE